MNRRQKIIVSVTGIFIVLLALVGITYAYFITKITGNTNTKSISVTTANLELVYGEDTNVIQGIDNAEPGYSVTKTFTATNTGNETVTYLVTLENIVNELNRKEDLVYTLTCVSKNKDTDEVSGTCNGVSDETQFPNSGLYSIVIENTIDVDIRHEYVLTVTYKEMNVNQSEDMNKTFSALVNLRDKNDKFFTALLSYNIINNAKSGLNGTKYSETPLTKPAEEVSAETESTLSVTEDDLGTSYYYRGAVEDNYVTFADMCWRIVRIEGDGSVKLVLEDQDEVCSDEMDGNWNIPTTGGTTYIGNFGYTQYSNGGLTASDGTTNAYAVNVMDYLHGTTYSDRSMATAFKDFQSTFTDEELSKLKSGNWCLDDTAYANSSVDITNSIPLTEQEKIDNYVSNTSFYYDSYARLYRNGSTYGYSPTLKCNGTIMETFEDDETNPTPMYVGTITADEIVYAGGKVSTSNENYYLINDTQKNNSLDFWLLSLSKFDFNDSSDKVFYVSYNGSLKIYNVYDRSRFFRISVSLAYGAQISSGDGTLESPYIIK